MFVAEALPLAESAPRYACVSCGRLECPTWPEACPTCLVAGGEAHPISADEVRVHLHTLDEMRRRRGL
jgi:hypothetical protein